MHLPQRVPKAELSPPDVAQVAAFLERAKVDDPALGRILHVLASTGARRGELCALRWRDLDVDRQSLSIERSVIEIAGGLSEKDTKTHSSRRIALGPGTLTVFEQQHIDAARLAKLAEAHLTGDSFIFSAEPGGATPPPPDSMAKRFQKLRDSLGLGRIRLHDLRHFTATRLIAAGVPIRTVSGRLGHANPSTTLAVYTHFVEARDQDAATVMGDLLSPS
jgi:integrase